MNVYRVCFTIRITCKEHTKDIDAVIVINANSDDEALKLFKDSINVSLNTKEPIIPYVVYRGI